MPYFTILLHHFKHTAENRMPTKKQQGDPLLFCVLSFKDDYSAAGSSAAGASAVSLLPSSSARIESESLLLSKSAAVIFTVTLSPTLSTLAGLETGLSEIWLMWIRPSRSGRISANAPNGMMETTVASTTSPTLYLEANMFHGSFSGVL